MGRSCVIALVLVAACGTHAPAPAAPEVSATSDGTFLLVERGAGPACEAWRVGDDAGFTRRADDVVEFLRDGLFEHDEDDVPGRTQNECDVTPVVYPSSAACGTARDAGSAAIDLRDCLHPPGVTDAATFRRFEELIANGGSMWSADGADCVEWNVEPAPSDDGSLAGTISRDAGDVIHRWEYRHDPASDTIGFGAVEDFHPDTGRTSVSPSNCPSSSPIATPAPGVILLHGRFFLDRAGCDADTTRHPAALDRC